MLTVKWRTQIVGLRDFTLANIELAMEEDQLQIAEFLKTTTGFIELLNNQTDGDHSFIQFKEDIKLFQTNVN